MSGLPSWAVKGAKVVCVDDFNPLGWHGAGDMLVVGRTYTISGTGHDPFGTAVLFLCEIERVAASVAVCPLSGREVVVHGVRLGYGVRRFRPLISQADDMAAHFSRFLDTRAPARQSEETV